MDTFEKIAVLDTEIQAQALSEALRVREIPHVLRSYHDSALDGLFQLARGWGHIEASPEHRATILKLLETFHAPVDPPPGG